MIIQKILSKVELDALLRDLQLQPQLYGFYLTTVDGMVQLMCHVHGKEDVAVSSTAVTSETYYKPAIQAVHPSGSNYNIINGQYINGGVQNVRYIIDDTPYIYCIKDGVPYIDQALEIGSFTYYVNTNDNSYRFYIYDGNKWLPIYVQGNLATHIARRDNPHSVTKQQIGLSEVENVRQLTKRQLDIHMSSNNPHRATKADVGLERVNNVEQLSMEQYDHHRTNRTAHVVTRASVGLDKVLPVVRQIPYEEFEREHLMAKNPHRITLEQLGLGNLDLSNAGNSVTKEEYTQHIIAKNPHGITKADVGLDAVENVKHVSWDVVQNHLYGRNPHKVNKEDIGLKLVRNVEQVDPAVWNAHVANSNNPHGVTKSDIGLERVNDVEQAIEEDLYNHVNNTDNPHGVTKEQVGLGRVRPVASVSYDQWMEHVNNYNNPHRITINTIAGVEHVGIDLTHLVSQSTFLEHIARRDNPHGITKADVSGLEMLENVRQLTKADYTAHTSLKNNPHRITKADVGLERVDNTAILSKPITAAFKVAASNKHLISLSQAVLERVRQSIVETQYKLLYSNYFEEYYFFTDGEVKIGTTEVAFSLSSPNNQGRFIIARKGTGATTVPAMVGYEDHLSDWTWYIAGGKIERLNYKGHQPDVNLSNVLLELFPLEQRSLNRDFNYYKDKTVIPSLRGTFNSRSVTDELLWYNAYNVDYTACSVMEADAVWSAIGYRGMNYEGHYATSIQLPLGNTYHVGKDDTEVIVPLIIRGSATITVKSDINGLSANLATVSYSTDGTTYTTPIQLTNNKGDAGVPSYTFSNDYKEQYIKFTIPQNNTGQIRTLFIGMYERTYHRLYFQIVQDA